MMSDRTVVAPIMARIRDRSFRLAPFAGIAAALFGIARALLDQSPILGASITLLSVFGAVWLTKGMLAYSRREPWQHYMVGFLVCATMAPSLRVDGALDVSEPIEGFGGTLGALLIGMTFYGLWLYGQRLFVPVTRRRTDSPLDVTRATRLLSIDVEGEVRDCPVWIVGENRSDRTAVVLFWHPTLFADANFETFVRQIPRAQPNVPLKIHNLVLRDHPDLTPDLTLWVAYEYKVDQAAEYFIRIVFTPSSRGVSWEPVFDPVLYWKIEVTAGGPAAFSRFREQNERIR